jgi:NAD(P)-dependent dehydrogenase (short-subunit alcohol dehydrogenase family)
MNSHDAKVGMITGAAAGIGKACALKFASLGYDLVLTDIDEDALTQAAEECRALGVGAELVAGDITAPELPEQCTTRALGRFGRLDVAVNCAGIAGLHRPAAEFSESEWGQVLSINLTAVWRCLKYEVLAMQRSGKGGAIVNISSTAGLKGYRHNSAYSASKHGVIGLTKCAAMDYAGEGIRINAICPGLVRTSLVEGVMAQHPGKIEAIAASHPVGRIGAPEEIADTASWLCSDMAGYIVGAVIVADGGHLAG